MNIDERLEALAQTVEILAGMQRENVKRMAEVSVLISQLALRHDHRLDNPEGLQ
jgi:hypothetical protein